MNVNLWSPISTCPTDEEPMDIWSESLGRCTNMARVEMGNGNVFWTAVESGRACVRDATHWMRVDPPSSDVREDA